MEPVILLPFCAVIRLTWAVQNCIMAGLCREVGDKQSADGGPNLFISSYWGGRWCWPGFALLGFPYVFTTFEFFWFL